MMNPIKKLRILTGLSQEAFCEEVETNRSYLSKLENYHNDMGLLKFLSWCKVFDIDPKDIFK